jgi:leucyl/phenylalanyl-tRNA--protein transferase
MPGSYFPDWDAFEIAAEGADEPVAFCGDLSPGSVLSAYRRGIVPLPAADEYLRDINEFRYEQRVADGAIGIVGDPASDPYRVAWWCPDPRPVIDAGGVHLGRNVRKLLRRADVLTTADRSFERVAELCRAGRRPRWLTDALLATMVELHRQGWAHSVEVWQDAELAGGAIGVAIGRVFSGDTLFGRHPDAARIAVADLAARFAAAGGQVIDAQWDSPLLRSLGARLVPRDGYLRTLAGPATRSPLPAQPLPARRLIDSGPAERPQRG